MPTLPAVAIIKIVSHMIDHTFDDINALNDIKALHFGNFKCSMPFKHLSLFEIQQSSTMQRNADILIGIIIAIKATISLTKDVYSGV
jgi:hypothetical protein